MFLGRPFEYQTHMALRFASDAPDATILPLGGVADFGLSQIPWVKRWEVTLPAAERGVANRLPWRSMMACWNGKQSLGRCYVAEIHTQGPSIFFKVGPACNFGSPRLGCV